MTPRRYLDQRLRLHLLRAVDAIETQRSLFKASVALDVSQPALGIDPETGHPFDDTKRYIDALPIPDTDKRRVFEGNARRVYPRLDAILKQQGR